jgi:hypothetical protein
MLALWFSTDFLSVERGNEPRVRVVDRGQRLVQVAGFGDEGDFESVFEGMELMRQS